MKSAVIHTDLVLRDHYLPDGFVTMEGGRITGFGSLRNAPDLSSYEVLDAKGLYTGPGLVDIHTHAAGTHWFYEEPEAACRETLSYGTTTVLPALYFNKTGDELICSFKRLKAAMKTPCGAIIGGFYVEAPYLNPKFGCERENNPWKGEIRREDYLPLLKEAGTDARVWVVAPEREHILDFVLDAKKIHPAVRFAVGHSEATPEQVEALIPYGLCIGTHHTNSTGDLSKYPECRGACVDEVVRFRPEIYAELISDRMGIHVDPYVQRMTRKIKGDDRIILISDSFAASGPVPKGGLYEGATDINFDDSGEIAGSKLHLIEACRNFMKHTGASLVDLFRCASFNPAAAVGFTDRGEIRVGAKADLIVTDHKMNLSEVILNGEVQ